MFITTKATAKARPVSLEQIAEMVIVQRRFDFITDLCWRRQKHQQQRQCVQSNNFCQNQSIFIANKNRQNFKFLHNKSSMDQRQRHQHRDQRGRRRGHEHHYHCTSHTKFSQPFIVIAVIVALALFVNCPAFVVAASKTAIRSIASSTNENDPNRIHNDWLEYQRQTLRPRATQSATATTTTLASATSTANNNHNSNYLSPELGNIFTQLGIFIQARQRNATEMAQHIFFKYYNTDGDLLYESNFSKPHDLYMAQCYPNGRFAILLHGWRESCNTPWMKQLIRKIGTFRGGCIICMDYGRYAAESYVRLVRVFDPIAQILTMQLHLLDYMGFDMNNGYLFGFSYGGQLATEAGRRIGHKRLKEIDTCDMAGPGFDHRSNQPNHREAAQNVQCIHTSRDKGTRFYNCHQDWRLGNCGLTQVASNSPPLGSHGLCPYMYVNAFENDFYAIIKPDDCVSKRMATYWPIKFKMGYMEKRKWQVAGELFAHTSKYHPFNIISNITDSSNAISKELVYRDIATPEVLQPNSNVLQKLKERILRYVFQDQYFH